MCERRGGLPVAALAAWLAAAAPAAGAAEPHAELLRRSDISSLAPESFRARLLVTPDSGQPQELEVWRAGESRTLVRFLAPKDRGKYLLRLEDALYFLSPRAKNAVKLDPAYRLGAASLDEMLGTRYSRDYAIESSSEAEDARGPLVVLELKARTPRAPWGRVRYVVRRELQRPVRVDFLATSGKTTGSVEFLAWEEKGRLRPLRLRVRDALRPKRSADVAIEEVEERSVPSGLFDLTDPSERRKLETSEPD
jgi:hypothetical protein